MPRAGPVHSKPSAGPRPPIHRTGQPKANRFALWVGLRPDTGGIRSNHGNRTVGLKPDPQDNVEGPDRPRSVTARGSYPVTPGGGWYAMASLPCTTGLMKISTRRLRRRPSGVSLLSTGFFSPMP